MLAAVSLPVEKFDNGLGEHTLKFMLHRTMSKFLEVVLINEGRCIIANILFVKVSWFRNLWFYKSMVCAKWVKERKIWFCIA